MKNTDKDGAIYRSHEKAFQQVSAFVVMRGADCVAKVAVKFPPAGHGERRVTAFVHVLGLPMRKGHADGCGYDKRSAAILSACGKLPNIGEGNIMRAQYPSTCETMDAFKSLKDNGYCPLDQLVKLGFSVFQAT